jgi:hypothetical protein
MQRGLDLHLEGKAQRWLPRSTFCPHETLDTSSLLVLQEGLPDFARHIQEDSSGRAPRLFPTHGNGPTTVPSCTDGWLEWDLAQDGQLERGG